MITVVVLTTISVGIWMLLYFDTPLRLILTNIYKAEAVVKLRRYVMVFIIIFFVLSITIIPYKLIKDNQSYTQELATIDSDLKWSTSESIPRALVERVPNKPQVQFTLIARDTSTTFSTIFSNGEVILLHNSLKVIVDQLAKETPKK